MKTNQIVTICDNCGSASLEAGEFARCCLTIDHHTDYEVDLCRADCLPKIVELFRRPIEAKANGADVAQVADVDDETDELTCRACGKTLKSIAGLRVHISRMHA